MNYSVRQLARLSGVSVRTLHYYDQIGLLAPAHRTIKGYRKYAEPDLLRLQQILFFRALDFPLKQIKKLMDDPGFDSVKALMDHRAALGNRIHHLQRLIVTVDKTIDKLTNKETMKDDELYEGFTREQRESYRTEAVDRWGEQEVIESEEKLRKLGKQGLKNLKQEGAEINQRLASWMHLSPDDDRVQQTIDLHFKHLNAFRTIDMEAYKCLGELYVTDERFKAHYDQVKEGLASFLKEAIQIYIRDK